MAGTLEGGLKAARTNMKRHGKDFYKRIGQKGGATSTGGGFAWMAKHDPQKVSEAGRKGGTKSRRGKNENTN